MKKTFKTIAKVVLSIVAALAFVAMTGEAETAKMQLIWTLGGLAVLAVSARLLSRLGAFDE